jgi:hypothetical protein
MAQTKLEAGQISGGSGGATTKDFNSQIVFDVPNQYMKTTQTADINITLSASGNTEHAYAQVNIVPDGVHALTISSDFHVQGVLDPKQNNLITLYYSQAGIKPKAIIENVPFYNTLGTPGSFTATTTGTINIALAWTAVTNATEYVLQRATDAGFTLNLATIYIGPTASYTDQSLPNATTYYYRVLSRAYGYTDSSYATATATTGTASSYSYSFGSTGTAQDIAVAGDSIFDFSNAGSDKPFSIAFRVKITSGNDFFIARNTASQRIFTVDISHTAGVQFALLDSTQNYLYKATGLIFNYGVWQHVAVTYDGSKTLAGMTIYLNGAAQTIAGSNSGYSSLLSGGTLNIGYDSKQSIQSTNALLDNLIIANRVLTQSEITTIYNNNTTIDLTAASFNSAFLGYWRFENNLNDSSPSGTHAGTATTPQYSGDV